MTGLYTIGYEGATLEDFLSALRAAGISRVLDIREFPGSRRRGFSKTALSAALAGAGIEYQHERALGSPRDARHRLRQTGDLAAFLKHFEAHLVGQANLLDFLADTLTGRVALLCYERDVTICHRRVVARELGARLGLEPCHLGVDPHGPQARESLRSGQGVPPAEQEVHRDRLLRRNHRAG